MIDSLLERVDQRSREAPWMGDCWRNAADALRQAFPERTETGDDRYEVHGTDQWKWALYRLNFAVKGRDRNSAAVELDPFEDLVRVIFFHEEVESQRERFEELATAIRHSTWDHRIDPQGPVEFPRTDGLEHCPEVKFEFDDREIWERHSQTIGELAASVYAEAAPGGN